MPLLQNDDADEQEAQRKRRFLEDGAEVELEPLRDYAPAAGRLAAPRPVTVELADTRDLAPRLASEDDAEAVVVLDLGHLPTTPDFSVLAFVNTPDADARTPTTDPGYLGTVAFFHGDRHDPAEPMRVMLPARQAIERTGADRPITVTLVPIPHPGRSITNLTLDVTASVQLVRSEVG
jgi:hypothetical protein